MRDYLSNQIRPGMRYADAVMLDQDGNPTADLSRISLLEPGPESAPATQAGCA